jgi:phospholipid/cholesterol/gamma-HCH transport system ATP-binding protein
VSITIIQFINVSKSFGEQKIFEKVNVGFPAGKTTVIAGGSGQGKSVILKLILGLMKPDSGSIVVDGHDITMMGAGALNKVRKNFGVLFQGSALFDSLTVYENVAMPLEERTGLSAKEIRERVMATLAEFDLLGHENKFPAQLSGGMKKRVGLARALQLQPKIMLFDEPTTGLDPAKSMEIYKLFFKTQQQFGFTSIIVSHDIPKIFNLADQVVILHGGRLNVFESSEEIQWSDDPEIRFFVEMTMGHVYQSQEMEAKP